MKEWSLPKPSAILFDVNETLMDMSGVKKAVNEILQSKKGYKIWFGLLLQYALVDTITGKFHDFGTIGGATLEMAAEMLRADLDEDSKMEVLRAMKEVPPHEEVKEALQRLKSAGFRLVTLTNSPFATLQNQLLNGELTALFEKNLSVEEFQLYKPHPETYRQALEKLEVEAGEAMMVAAHGWDIAGAAVVGMQTAFIRRKGQALYPLAPKPTLQAKDLTDLANILIKGLEKDQYL